MSLKRRRWSNELIDSLVDFQAKENSQLIDSLENDNVKSKNSLDNCSVISSMIEQINLKDLKENKKCADDNNLENCESLNVILNTSMLDNRTVCQKDSSTTPTGHDNISSTSLDTNKYLFNFNERLSHNINESSDSGTIKASSCNSDLNERIEMHTSDSGTIKASSCNSSFLDLKEIKSADNSACCKANNSNSKEENSKQRFFSSPVIANKDADFISNIAEPDIWETLVALEQMLSPFEDHAPHLDEKHQDPPQILNRLSQKFKKTPTQFTEKLVSIIEDSIVSLESPTKATDNSGISLHRMTGEFRKLCKFIEDESMPDWAPSLINMTEVDQIKTPPEEKNNENVTPKTATNETKNANDSPIFRFTPKGCRIFTTPKKNSEANNQTPLRNFTPSADKSFEYWEEVCNMMYKNQNSGKKNPIKRFSILKSVKSNMDDLLTRCEKQMASLDETGDIRCSEPCRKPVNDLQPNPAAPRSKSVSNLLFNTKESKKQLHVEEMVDKKYNVSNISNSSTKTELSGMNNTLKNEDQSVKSSDQNVEVIKLDDDIENTIEVKEGSVSNDEDDYVLSTNKVFRRNPNVSIEGCNTSLYSPATMQAASYGFDESNADCSLLIELAKRRQRCLDTAKLMMEIDREDPMTTNDDTKCVETLYKLGIQDQTFVEVQDDVKFLNTLNHCFEYKKYLSDKSKPIVNMFSTVDSPEILKSKTLSMLRSKSTFSRPQSSSKTISKGSVYNKPPLESKRTLKNVQSRIATPKVITAILPKTTPRPERKISQTSNLQPSVKLTPRVSSRKLSPGKLDMPRSTRKLSSTVNSHSQLRRTPSVGAIKTVELSTRANLATQPKKLGIKRTSSAKISLNKEVPKPMLEAKVQSSLKTKLRRTPSVEVPKLQNLRPDSANKPSTKGLSSRLQTTSKLQINRLTPEGVKSNENKSEKATTSNIKKCTPEQDKSSEKSGEREISVTPQSVAELLSQISPEQRKMPKKGKLFLTPGKSPSVAALGRKKPMTYFSEVATKTIDPQKVTYDNVKSPIGMYVHSTDTELIQNIQARINDRLLTPVTNATIREGSMTPKLKFELASKENQSPTVNCDENMVLPFTRYESAKKVCLTQGKSPFTNSNAPNSKTRKLLEPVENTVVIRHEGRVIHYNPNPNCSNAEMSIRVQKVADKISSMKKKLV